MSDRAPLDDWSLAPTPPPRPLAVLAGDGDDVHFSDDDDLAGDPAADPHGPPHGCLSIIRPALLAGSDPPERSWRIPGWLPDGAATGLYGDGGTGKSLLAMQVMTAVATGLPFGGLPVTRGPALGVFAEDDPDELHRRQSAINDAMGCDFGDLAEVRWISRVGLDNALMTFAGGIGTHTDLWHDIRSAALDCGARLVVLDSAADLFAGNENDRSQVRQFVQGACARLALDIGGAVLLVAHPSRAGMATGTGDSGSTGWSNAFRSRWYFERPAATDDDPTPDRDARVLTRKKANYASTGERIDLRYRAGAFVPDGSSAPLAWIDQRSRDARADAVFLALLDRLTAEGRPVSHKARASNFAPKAMAKHPGRDGLTRADFAAAMERLFSDQKISITTTKDAHRNRVEMIVRAP